MKKLPQESLEVQLRTFIKDWENLEGKSFHKSNKKLVISKNMSEYKPLRTAVENGKYHACFNVYEDGASSLIKKGEKCYLATNDPFRKT